MYPVKHQMSLLSGVMHDLSQSLSGFSPLIATLFRLVKAQLIVRTLLLLVNQA